MTQPPVARMALGHGHAGAGPRAVLACPPGELHDLPFMIFGIALNRLGWRVTYLGMSTPLDELIRTFDATQPALVVIAATVPDRLEAIAPSSPSSPDAHPSPWPALERTSGSRKRPGPACRTAIPSRKPSHLAQSAEPGQEGGADRVHGP